ncbi:DUF1266 domain-containing protein [Streptomyces reniochalinae]|uniref:DUF1266 domain-containing protein n=1 Tax=Streptomyces reniochalinae TaxID=2250578 RepID=A0A367EMQ3_9ACTN|nr:DUF1266 domain-containing protein [Streptomyces reniochalinae]RCG18490.1 DUF1266 domain-containing protein [Streptomyces reniochalinae]
MGTRGRAQGESTGWTAPTEVEDALAEAREREDWDAYLAALTRAELFVYVFKDQMDRGPVQPRLYTRDGGWCLEVRTRGMLLREPRKHLVAARLPDPGRLWKRWKLSDADYVGLVVNPGTPVEAYFPGGRALARRWHRLARKSEPPPGENVLRTRRNGILTGPFAHGLACGAHLAVRNAVFWNDVGDVCLSYADDEEILRELWGVTDHAGWREQLDHLLAGTNSPGEPEFVLGVRAELARLLPGTQVTAEQWREAAFDCLVEAHDGAMREAERRALRAVLTSVTGKILRYEARFRADGLLPPSGRVRSALAYDYGRAVNVARWGRGARLATTMQAEEAVIRAGELCRETYDSWAELSAGYVLGRALRFDEETFGEWYQSSLIQHRILTGDPVSPWRSLSFGTGAPL